MKKVLAIILTAALVLAIMPASLAAAPKRVVLNGDSNVVRFDGWGTSLCWWAEVLGGLPESDRLKISEALFDRENGLGLNIVRYNIGAGDDPSHTHLNNGRGMPVWVDEQGKFNPDADPNQINFLKDSVSMGADIVELFSNSPPYYMTVSGCSSGGKDSNENNIDPSKFGEFAEYLATVTDYIQNDLGIKVDSLEPMNEANTNFWGYEGSQEGCHIDVSDHSALVVATAQALSAHGLNNVIVAASDENNMDVMAGYIDRYSDQALALMPRLNVHSYGGGYGGIVDKARQLGKEIYMTEVDGDGSIGYDSGNMGPALWFSKKIADDMNNLRPNAWVCWQVTDVARLGSHPDNGYWNLSEFDLDTHTFTKLKKYYAYAHYTKFIRPGDTFLRSDSNTVFAARDLSTGRVSAVITNAGMRDETYQLDLTALENPGAKVTVYRTDKTRDMELIPGAAAAQNGIVTLSIPKDSITTVVVENDIPTAVNNTGVTITAQALSCFGGESLGFSASALDGSSVTLTSGSGTISDGILNTASVTGETVVVTASANGVSASETVDIINNGDAVRLVNVNSGLALQEQGYGYVQYGDNDSASQYWIINKTGDIATFTNVRSGKLLSDGGFSEWRVELHDGGYSIVNTATNSGLDVFSHATHEGAQVGTYEFNGGNNQLWNFKHGNPVRSVDSMASSTVVKRLMPTAIDGTAPYGGNQDVSYEKVFDGDIETHHDAWDGENSYVSATMPAGEIVTMIRFAPRTGFLPRMYGGKFYGVNGESETLLYTVGDTIRNGWNQVYIDNDTVYEKIVYRTPAGGLCNVSELEFYSAPMEAELSYDAGLNISVKNHGAATNASAVLVYHDAAGQISAVDVKTIDLERYGSIATSVALAEGHTSVDVYILSDGAIISSGYIFMERI